MSAAGIFDSAIVARNIIYVIGGFQFPIFLIGEIMETKKKYSHFTSVSSKCLHRKLY